ncbi:MAG: vitamin K epoxide reductase family protein [Verrucomicrobiota bacterium]|nr:vitamin K epoxide reductase family protein [Verrucomicrobiota bacterium]
MKRKARPRPARKVPAPAGDRLRTILFAIAAVIGAAGVGETIYLTALHLAGAHVTCIASSTCSQVLGSKYAVVGGIPLAAFGVAAYFTVFCAATLAAFRYPHASRVFGAMVGVMFLGTLWLLYLQAFVLHAFCDYCLLSAAMIFGLTAILMLLPMPAARQS